jgi:hypothetical protein
VACFGLGQALLTVLHVLMGVLSCGGFLGKEVSGGYGALSSRLGLVELEQMKTLCSSSSNVSLSGELASV